MSHPQQPGCGACMNIALPFPRGHKWLSFAQRTSRVVILTSQQAAPPVRSIWARRLGRPTDWFCRSTTRAIRSQLLLAFVTPSRKRKGEESPSEKLRRLSSPRHWDVALVPFPEDFVPLPTPTETGLACPAQWAFPPSLCWQLRRRETLSLLTTCCKWPAQQNTNCVGNPWPSAHSEKLRVATLHGRLPTSPGSLAHNRLSHSSGTVRNLSLKPPNTSENFKCCTSCSQTLAPFSHTSQTNWP